MIDKHKTLNLPLTEEMHEPAGRGLGDSWKTISFKIQKGMKANKIVRLSKYYVKNGTKKYVDNLEEVKSCLEDNQYVQLFDAEEPTVPHETWRESWSTPMMPAVVRWKPNISKRVGYQFDGKSHKEKNFPSRDAEESVLRCMESYGYTTVKLGRPLSLEECLNVASELEIFVGVESGMGYVCSSVGTPVIYVLNNKRDILDNMTDRCFLPCDDAIDFEVQFAQYVRNRSYYIKNAKNMCRFYDVDNWKI